MSAFCCPAMKYTTAVVSLVLAIGAAGVISGCNAKPAPPAAQETAPAEPDFGSLVDKFEEHYKTIDEGKADGSIGSVHSSMHSVGSTLKKLALAAGDAGVSTEQMPEFKSTIKRLAEIYGDLDHAQHGGDEVNYDDLAPELGELVEKLKGFKP